MSLVKEDKELIILLNLFENNDDKINPEEYIFLKDLANIIDVKKSAITYRKNKLEKNDLIKLSKRKSALARSSTISSASVYILTQKGLSKLYNNLDKIKKNSSNHKYGDNNIKKLRKRIEEKLKEGENNIDHINNTIPCQVTLKVNKSLEKHNRYVWEEKYLLNKYTWENLNGGLTSNRDYKEIQLHRKFYGGGINLIIELIKLDDSPEFINLKFKIENRNEEWVEKKKDKVIEDSMELIERIGYEVSPIEGGKEIGKSLLLFPEVIPSIYNQRIQENILILKKLEKLESLLR